MQKSLEKDRLSVSRLTFLLSFPGTEGKTIYNIVTKVTSVVIKLLLIRGSFSLLQSSRAIPLSEELNYDHPV